MLCGLAVAGDRLGSPAPVLFAVAAVLAGAAAIAVLDSARWRPPGIAERVSTPMPLEVVRVSTATHDA